ncbi:Helicase SKI2W [Hypsibius exemplaris]|uniref:Helicase SKI2W n=1 Tax=Hypsibius exemplaris TaxID=2072580 RepID=A0A1W0WLT9_HYPEX|nr:Helicase SKI2W [Hypsibius exemplaris]
MEGASSYETMARHFDVALDAKRNREEEESQWMDPDRQPYFRQFATPTSSILSAPGLPTQLKELAAKDPQTWAKIELQLQPENLLRECLTLPDLQQCKLLDGEMPMLLPEWDLPPLDFEMSLDRDPFSGRPGEWHEVPTSGFEISSHTSGAMTRDPAGMGEEFVFGSITQMPFTPGGMEDIADQRNRILDLTPEEMEKGREWVRNIKSLPHLPPDIIADATTDEFNFNSDLPSEFDEEIAVNGIGDLMDERELSLVKRLQKLGGATETKGKTQQPLSQEMHQLLEMAEFGDIYRELNPEAFFEGKPRSDTFVKISDVVDPRNVQEWAVKVDISIPIRDFADRMPNMAHKYPFELDTFQKQAVLHLENHESVFVAAHTSAGKTVVAEYAIALSLRAKSRCVYTSPIKALSNQKYRDFKKTFGDVGLLTGDIQIEPNSHCLVMTTEILRSMLYRGSEIVRDLDWVVFDEVHYINDSERGVVWEEILIMLPAQVGIVMLSATVPNAVEFANWIGRIKQRKIYVITTLKRPVPLEHHMYVCVGSKTIDKDLVIVNPKGELQTKNHAEAIEIKKEYEKRNNIRMGLSNTSRLPPKQDKTVWLAFMNYIREKDLMPVIAFVFSRNRCDELGDMICSLDLTTQKEKHTIKAFFHRVVARLNDSDRELPQIRRLEYYLERGVGIHHSGILPILKEAVEMLFQEGVVKILFATETFAMGVNMPARTVVFDSTTKHDGMEFRDLRPGEYIQMSGRAGRRGLDKTGTVIILCKMARVPDITKLNQMILGVPTKLESKFRLTYGMILQLLRVGTISILDMMKRSFSEYSNTSKAPEHEAQLKKLTSGERLTEEVACSICEVDIEGYYRAFKECKKLRRELNSAVFSLESRLLTPGRIVTTWDDIDQALRFGVIVSTPVRQANSDRYFHILEFSALGSADKTAHVKRVACGDLYKVLNAIVKVQGDMVMSEAEKVKTSTKVPKSYRELVEKISAAVVPLMKADPLSPGRDFGMTDFDILDKARDLVTRESILGSEFRCLRCPQFVEHIGKIRRKMELEEEVARLRHLLSNESLRFLPEYQQRLQVLRTLRYVTEDNAITLRARVACEVSTTEYDLLVAECLFNNIFTDREPAEIAALLSGLVFQGKTNVQLLVPPSLQEGIDQMRIVAENIGYQQRVAGMKEATTHLADELNFGLTDVVYQWCMGKSFVEIAASTDVQEGIIVRTMTRLDEVCRDVRAAAKVTGNSRLIAKMELAAKALKRDIAFIGSLYTTD